MEGFKIQDLLTEDLVFLDVEAEDDESLIRSLAAEAEKLGYVKEGWADAVISRERIYPTGLPTEVMKVAVPHSVERDQVNKPVIIIAMLKNPVNFKEMGDGEQDVPVEAVFMLAVCGNKDQLTILQSVVGMFSDDTAMTDVKNAHSKQEVIAALIQHLGE